MFRIILLCLLTCCSSFMPLKQSDSIVSEGHTQVVEKKTKENYFSGQDGVNFVSSDFLSFDFGRIFYDYIKDFDSPRTENLSYNRTYNPINYEYISDTPIGHLHYGGFSYNVWPGISGLDSYQYGGVTATEDSNGTITTNYADGYIGWKLYLLPNTTYYFSCQTTYLARIWNYAFNALLADNNSSFTTDSSGIVWLGLNATSSRNNVCSNIMISVGNSALPYEKFFTGIVQYASLPCYSFTLSKEIVNNSQYNGYTYHYVLKFYSRNPNGRPLLFGVDSYVIPHLKWEDNQGNLYGDNFYVVSKMIFNDSLSYNLNNLVYSERSDDSAKPLLNCYVNNFTKEFSDDEYTMAFNTGYDEGYNNGNNFGYQRGYSQGVSDTIAGNSQAMTIFAGIMDVAFIPVNVFFLMFDYEVFGINIAGFVSGLITIAIVIILMRFIFGRKV